MTRPARFWPLATIIILPVLVLAGVASYGLKVVVERQEVQEREQLEQWVLPAAAEKMQAALDGLWATTAPVVPFSDPPAPRVADEGAQEWERLAALAEASKPLRALRDAPGPSAFTAAGLPVRPLAAWRVWSTTGAEEDARRLTALVLAEPSAISGPALQRLAAALPGNKAAWLEDAHVRWQGMAAVQEALAQLPDVALEDAEDGPPVCRYFQDREGTGWVFLRTPQDDVKLLPEAAVWPVLERAIEGEKKRLPGWAALLTGGPGTAPPRHAIHAAGPFWPVLEVDHEQQGQQWAGLLRWGYAHVVLVVITAVTGLWFLRRTLTKERRLGELKSQFVSSVSHELRAPVGSLRLMADGLASGKVTGAAADEFHRLMAGEGARLSSLIENVLDFARIEQGRKEYHMAETDIAALVHDAVKLMTPQAETRQQRIVTDLAPLPFVPRVDAGALQQALINLLDNAIKFSPPDTEVRVSLAADPPRNAWSLAVTDHGPGIPREEHVRIFERFYRLGNELRRETTGTGIGLAIVKHIVEGHGGRVTVDSAPGKGSTFRMEFPSVPSVP